MSFTVLRMTVSATSKLAGEKESMVAVSLQWLAVNTLQPMHITMEANRIIRQ